MAITELIFPVYKQDQESVSQLSKKAPEIFSHFRDVKGLKSLFRGTVIVDNDEPVGSDAGRSVIALEWDEVSSFHSFYPHSPSFQAFMGSVKPFIAGPARPELFEASDMSTHCLSSTVCQIIKGPHVQGSENEWIEIQKMISDAEAPTPGFFYATSIEEEQSHFLAIIGWPSIEDYERTGKSKAIKQRLQAMGASDTIYNIVVELVRVNL